MKYTNLFLTAIAGLFISACSSDNEIKETPVSPSQEQVEIKLGSSVNAIATTRALTVTPGDVIPTGETVYAWIDDVGDPGNSIAASEHVSGWTLTAAAPANVGDPQALNSTGTTKYYYPSTGRNINVYALHGNFNNAVTEGTTTWATFSTTLTHEVKKNQTGIAAAAPENYTDGYDKSDLYCAHLLNQAKTATALQLPFKHVLSKIEVYLFRGTGVTGADIAGISSITLKNVELTGDVTLSKPTVTTTPIASVTVPATPNKGDITMKLQTDASGVDKTTEVDALAGFTPDASDKKAYAFAEAIIIPQTIGDTTTPTPANFISVNFGAGGSLVAKVAQPFTAGNRYCYFIKVDRTGLQLTATLSDWTSGGITGGTAE